MHRHFTSITITRPPWLDARNLRFDQNIIGPTNQHQMLDIVSTHQHQLPFLVEIEHINGTQPRLPTARAWHLDAAAKQIAYREITKQQEHNNEQNGSSHKKACPTGEKPRKFAHYNRLQNKL